MELLVEGLTNEIEGFTVMDAVDVVCRLEATQALLVWKRQRVPRAQRTGASALPFTSASFLSAQGMSYQCFLDLSPNPLVLSRCRVGSPKPSYGGLRSPPRMTRSLGPKRGRMKEKWLMRDPANLMVLM